MEKQFLKRKLPSMIIVEGFWNVGKTALLEYITKINGFEKICEPDHLIKKVQKNISGWYIEQHNKRMDVATGFLRRGKRVALERSVISSMAYKFARGGKLSPKERWLLKKMNNTEGGLSIAFLYAGKKFIKQQSKKITDKETKSLLLGGNFYDKYLEFYKLILPEFIDSIKFIKVDAKKSFKDKNAILKQFYKSFPLLEKELVECASIVSFYKDKILLLYDHEYRHYVLPQGHKEKGESLSETALREMKEETGFDSLKIIKKIRKYQYHYPTKKRIIYKSIHVFLVEITSTKQVKKKLEGHENYTNKFFSQTEAVNKARWPQDKEVIALSIKYIKSPRTRKAGD